MRRHIGLFLLFTTFLGAVLFPYLWLKADLGNRQHTTVHLIPRTSIPGYRFVNEPVAPSLMEGLGTTNILSGDFLPLTNTLQRVTVFFATWSGDAPSPFKGFGHTPDVCWVGAGWIPVSSVGTQRIDLEIPFSKNAEPLPSDPAFLEVLFAFDTQTFERPETGAREQAAWCTLMAGKPLSSSKPLKTLSSTALGAFYQSRGSLFAQLMHAVANRSLRNGKQFIRFSSPVEIDSARTRKDLESFGSQWLRAVENNP